MRALGCVQLASAEMFLSTMQHVPSRIGGAALSRYITSCKTHLCIARCSADHKTHAHTTEQLHAAVPFSLCHENMLHTLKHMQVRCYAVIHASMCLLLARSRHARLQVHADVKAQLSTPERPRSNHIHGLCGLEQPSTWPCAPQLRLPRVNMAAAEVMS